MKKRNATYSLVLYVANSRLACGTAGNVRRDDRGDDYPQKQDTHMLC